MHRRHGLLILLTGLIVLASTCLVFAASQRSGLPFSVHVIEAHTAVIEPIPGISWPPALESA